MSEEYTVATEEELEYEATIARLRAQNRDLLAALEAVMEVAFDGPSSPVSSTMHREWKDGIERQARAAIAAAKETK